MQSRRHPETERAARLRLTPLISGATRGVRFVTGLITAGLLFSIAMAACGRSTVADRDPVARMLEALGGAPAIERLTSLAVEADCTGPSGSFQTTVQSLRPGRVFFAQKSEGDSTRIWSTPARTWTIEGGIPKSVPEGLRDFVRGHEFHLLLFEVESRFPTREAGGEVMVDGRPFTRIGMSDEGGHPATLMLDQETFLPRSLELNPPGAQGPVSVFFADWRREGDLLYFGSFRLTEGPDRTFTYRYTRIAPNRVEPGLFDEPAGPMPAPPE